MTPLENSPQNSVTSEISTQTTRHPANILQRAVWTVCLMVIGLVVVIHAALAYSPELARYVPDVLVKSPAATPGGCSSHAVVSGGCQTRAVTSGDFGGCCSMRVVDRPLLTDRLYHEDDEPSVESHAESPVDALECLPDTVETPESTEPQAGAVVPTSTSVAVSTK